MKFFLNHTYRYAVEQMIPLLFYGDRPEYVETVSRLEDQVVSRYHVSTCYATATASVRYKGKTAKKMCRLSRSKLPESDIERRRIEQYMIRTALYQAAVAVLPKKPEWGSLTGVRPCKIPVQAMERGKTREEAKQLLAAQYDVSPKRISLTMDCADVCLQVKNELKPREISIYIGIPFCPTRCAYCSFISADVNRCLKLLDPYVEALIREIHAAGDTVRKTGTSVKSIYIGGGTPSTLSAEQMERMLKAVNTAFDLAACAEFTVEAGRPDTITADKLRVMKENGVDRISINPQTMQDDVLRAIGRAHTSKQTEEAMELASRCGFGAINMDLIAGLPSDTTDGFLNTVEKVLALCPENITIHTLALKKGAALRLEQHPLPDGSQIDEMLCYAEERLRKAGYRPYYLYRQKYIAGGFENVGWCRPGKESIYNICMMEELHCVLALGCGGVSKLITRESGKICRVANPKYPYEYIDRIDEIVNNKRELASELMKVLPDFE